MHRFAIIAATCALLGSACGRSSGPTPSAPVLAHTGDVVFVQSDGRAQPAALAALSALGRTLRDEGAGPAALIVTGRFGIDAVPTDSAVLQRVLANVTGALVNAAITRVIVVPRIDAADSLPGWTALLTEARTQLARRGIALSFCADRVCAVEIPGTTVRAILFPSRLMLAGDTAARAAAFDSLDAAVQRAASDGSVVVIATDLAPLEPPGDTLPPWGAENGRARWIRLVRSGQVDVVLAGGISHDGREAYRTPYFWIRSLPGIAAASQLALAPPLALAGDTAVLLGTRGVQLLRPGTEPLERRLMWANSAGTAFETAPRPVTVVARELPRCAVWQLGCLLSLWRIAAEPRDLAQGAVFVVALLLAFLTVAETWKITKDDDAGPGDGGKPFRSKFAQTVFAGIGGIVAVHLGQDILGATDFNAKAYYVVVFGTLVLTLLVASALYRGFTEGLRARQAIGYVAPSNAGRWHRFVAWSISWRPSLLVSFDTAFNAVQGRNQLHSVVWVEQILDLQASHLRALDKIRAELHRGVRAVLAAPRGAAHDSSPIEESYVRVNISLLDESGKNLYYISATTGSSPTRLSNKSVAWFTASKGEARWWKDAYDAFKHETTQVLQTDVLKHDDAGTDPCRIALQRLHAGDGGLLAENDELLISGSDGRGKAFEVGHELAANDAGTLATFAKRMTDEHGTKYDIRIGATDGPHLTISDADSGRDLLTATLLVRRASGEVVRVAPFNSHTTGQPVIDLAVPRRGDAAGHTKYPLAQYFQSRSHDYQAFIVIPIPMDFRSRAGRAGRVGVLHISLAREDDLDLLFSLNDRVSWHDGHELVYPNYGGAARLLDATPVKHRDSPEPPQLRDPELRRALRVALIAAAECIQGLTDASYPAASARAGRPGAELPHAPSARPPEQASQDGGSEDKEKGKQEGG